MFISPPVPAQEITARGCRCPVPDLHHLIGLSQRSKPELLIQTMSVARHEQEQTQVLKIRMIEDRPQQCLRNPVSSILRDDEHVHQIREYRPIGNHSRERHLLSVPIDAKTQRILNRALDDSSPAPSSPIRRAQEAMNEVDVEACDVRGDLELRRHGFPMLVAMSHES
jgi:hypothetical protein